MVVGPGVVVVRAVTVSVSIPSSSPVRRGGEEVEERERSLVVTISSDLVRAVGVSMERRGLLFFSKREGPGGL